MNLRNIAASSVVAAVMATGALANSLTITDVNGHWENAVANPNTGTISGTGTSTITWGTPVGTSQSGYDFAGVTPPNLLANEGTAFSLGTFTHNNFAITGTSLDTVDLEVDITIDGVPTAITTVFSFDHTETPNNANPCAEGGTAPCPDLVEATLNLGASDFFSIGGIDYVFNILGFSTDNGATILTDFLTAEGQANSAQLMATFQTRTSVVPLPAGFLLMGTALAGFGVMRRKKKAA